MADIKIAMIGTGIMADIYARVIGQRENCLICCVAGNSAENTMKFAEAHNIKGYPGSAYDQMFDEHPEIDAVIITTPEWVRIDPVTASVNNKKHILLEKPFACSLDEALALNKILKGYDKVFEICHVLRFSPRFYALYKSIANNDVGDIRHIYARRNSNNKRVARVLGKTDLAYWLTPHDIDIMRWITGSEVKEVYAVSRNGLLSADDYLTANLKFENGVDAVLQISWCNPPLSGTAREAVFEVWGNKGYLELEDFAMNIKVFNEKQSVSVYDTYEDYDIHGIHRGMFENLIDNFIRKVQNEDVSTHSLKDSLESIRICEMISRSIKTKQVITSGVDAS